MLADFPLRKINHIARMLIFVVASAALKWSHLYILSIPALSNLSEVCMNNTAAGLYQTYLIKTGVLCEKNEALKSVDLLYKIFSFLYQLKTRIS